MLWPNLQSPESTPGNTGNNVNFLANGFQIRNADGDQNTTGRSYVWAAWAENPFSGENTAPANAR